MNLFNFVKGELWIILEFGITLSYFRLSIEYPQLFCAKSKLTKNQPTKKLNKKQQHTQTHKQQQK